MSIVGLRKAFRKKLSLGFGRYKVKLSLMEIGFYLIVVSFIVGAYYGFGGARTGSGRPRPQQAERHVSKNIATVNGDAIPRREFELRYYMYLDRARVPEDQALTQGHRLKMNVFEGMIREQLLLDAAKQSGINVTGAEVDQEIDDVLQQMLDARFPTRQRLVEYLRDKNMSYEDYKAQERERLLERQERDQFRQAVLFEKLQQQVKSQVTVTDEDLKDKYTKIKARHIVIQPQQLKQEDEQKEQTSDDSETAEGNDNPDKNDEAAEKGTQTADEDEETGGDAEKTAKEDKDYEALARKRAEQLLKKLKEGADFAEMAKEYSHDPATAQDGGLLHSSRPPQPGQDQEQGPSEYIGRGEMYYGQEFDEAAFSLEQGKISDVVETSYGYHIIKVIDRKVEYPDDYKDNKQAYRSQVLQEKKEQTWQDFIENLKDKANIEIQATEIAAYKALEEGNEPEAMQLLARTVQDDPQNDIAKYRLAMLLKQSGENVKAIGLLNELAEDERTARAPQVHIELGNLLLEQGNEEHAIDALNAASQWAQAYNYQNMFLHQRLKAKFEELDEKQLAKKEQEWIDEFMAEQQKKQQGMSMPVSPGS